MFKNILKLVNIPIIRMVIHRTINCYTGSGIVIVLMQLEALEILSRGITQAVEGVPAKEVLVYLALGVGIYLILHKPKFNNKLEKIQEEIVIEKKKKELKNTERK